MLKNFNFLGGVRVFPSHATLFVITKHIWAYAVMAGSLFQEPLSGRLLGIPDHFFSPIVVTNN